MVQEQTSSRGAVVQSYATEAEAEAAVRSLRDAGFTSDEISVVSRDPVRARTVAEDTGVEVAKGAGIGAATGGVLGAIAGLLAGAAIVTVPGVGIILAGPLALALGGAVTGGITGGLAGALAGLGVAHDEARHYQGRLEAGDIVVVVAAGPREPDARTILHSGPGRPINP
jgi:hypothetical protein